MTHEEAKRAFYHKIPVEYAGTQYLYIQALRYCWQRNGEGSGPLMQLDAFEHGLPEQQRGGDPAEKSASGGEVAGR